MRENSTVLVAYDGSDPAVAALEHALESYPESGIAVLTVINPSMGEGSGIDGFPASPEAWFERAREDAATELDDARAIAETYGVEIETAIEVGRPSSVIVTYAEENDVDHVVLGSHGRKGLSRILLGSVAEAVVRRSPVPVTVVR
ncbi:MAG TPA: universal stress protein [Natrialbaceae archaeon]|nr:universal stress protein [Natrialbaceae archaeon]